MTSGTCSPDELRTLFLFEKLSDDQLGWLCRQGRVEVFPAGPVYREGDPATAFYVLLDGTVVLSRRVGSDDIEAGRTSQRGVYAGAWLAYLGDRFPQVYPSSMRVTEPSRFFVLDADVFAQLMREWFPMAVHLLEGGLIYRANLQELTGQRERLLALGSLSAGPSRTPLDITWRIVVNKHHGDIQLESVPGDTRFRVRLPVTAANMERTND